MSFPVTEVQSQLLRAGQVVLDQGGNGVLTFDPGSARERWEVQSVVVSTNQASTATNVPVATVAKNTAIVSQLSQGNNRGASWSGNQDVFAGLVDISAADFLSVLFSPAPGTALLTATLFGQAATGSTVAADANPYTLAVEFTVTEAATVTGAWWYSAASAAAVPQTLGLYQVSGQSLVHSETVTWSGAAGSGWVKTMFAAPPVLAAGVNYKLCVLQSTNANWYSSTAGYWSSGAGANGITSGIMTALSNAAASPGQGSYNSGASLAYPSTNGSGANYWIDPLITYSALSGVIAYATVTGKRYTRRA